jgi:hypothetical protein
MPDTLGVDPFVAARGALRPFHCQVVTCLWWAAYRSRRTMKTYDDRETLMGYLARETDSEIRLVQDAPEVTEEFGLRVSWQSEAEQIEAAEFLIATRMQEDVRRRIAKETMTLREQSRETFSTFVQRHSSD